MIRTIYKSSVAVGMVMVLGACVPGEQTRPSCPVPDGTRCMSAIDVYRATHNGQAVGQQSTAGNAVASTSERRVVDASAMPAQQIEVAPLPSAAVYRPVQHASTNLEGDTLALEDVRRLPNPTGPVPSVGSTQQIAVSSQVGIGGTVHANAAPPTEPLRQPAQVMRIFVQAWEDEQGNLHMPGHIYTEIEPRRWRVGGRVPTGGQRNFRLLEGFSNTSGNGNTAAHEAQGSTPASVGTGRPTATNQTSNQGN